MQLVLKLCVQYIFIYASSSNVRLEQCVQNIDITWRRNEMIKRGLSLETPYKGFDLDFGILGCLFQLQWVLISVAGK